MRCGLSELGGHPGPSGSRGHLLNDLRHLGDLYGAAVRLGLK